MRFAWLVLVSSTALAAPPKPVRKPAPPALDTSALGSFVEAIVRDKAGDYERAITSYRNAGKDLPAIVYNIADLYRRMEDYEQAIASYKKYLELAPNAPDRAVVQRLIDQLAKTPMQLVVDGDDLDAVVFIDGEPAGASPLVTQLADGRHVVDRIGPTSFEGTSIEAKPLKHKHMTSYREATGNVVMSTSSQYGGTWRDGDKTFRMHDRFALPPGRIDTFYYEPGRACSPVSFEVPADGVVYVFIDAPKDWKQKDGCTPIKVTAQKIAFPNQAKVKK